jgi:ankyrin repeat protein
MKTTAKGGATPLMMAVLMGRTENVRALIEAGYDVAPERKALLPLAAGNADIQKLLQNPPAHKNR